MFSKYPRLSVFWCLSLVLFVLTFDATYLLSYLLALIPTVYGLSRPQVSTVVEPYLQRIFFDHRNMYYRPGPLKVMTIRHRDFIEAKRDHISRYAPNDENNKKDSLSSIVLDEIDNKI